jgi:hypothetical protein
MTPLERKVEGALRAPLDPLRRLERLLVARYIARRHVLADGYRLKLGDQEHLIAAAPAERL